MSEKIDRRSFLETLGELGMASALVASFPWLQGCTPKAVKETAGERVRLGIIGTGSRGQYHITDILQSVPQAEIVAICDNYEPNLQTAALLLPDARQYSDYRRFLEDNEVQGVIIATPLHLHYRMTIDALDAGKAVFCEKAMAYSIEECYDMYRKGTAPGRILYVGQQRLFSPKYLFAMDKIRKGEYGPVVNVRNYWFRNSDWRRPVPSPDLERHINWRLYREYSRGIMAELACHQLQNGSWAIGMYPEKVMGSGSLVYWKDGREVFDSVAVIYTFPNGVNMTFESVISNWHFGMGEQVLCKDATIDLLDCRVYLENPPAKSGIEQLIAEIEKGVFSNAAFAGTSWNAEDASKDKGIALMPQTHGEGGSVEIIQSFCHSILTGCLPEQFLREAYYASVFSILGDEAMLRGETLTLPEEFKV